MDVIRLEISTECLQLGAWQQNLRYFRSSFLNSSILRGKIIPIEKPNRDEEDIRNLSEESFKILVTIIEKIIYAQMKFKSNLMIVGLLFSSRNAVWEENRRRYSFDQLSTAKVDILLRSGWGSQIAAFDHFFDTVLKFNCLVRRRLAFSTIK